MDYILAYAAQDPTLYQHRVTTLPFKGDTVPFDPSRITTHLATDHEFSSPPKSSNIAASILSDQLSRGFNSDDVVGSYMESFDPTAPVTSLSVPTVGAAWNFFEDRVTSMVMVDPSFPINGQAVAKLTLVIDPNTSYGFPYLSLTPTTAPSYSQPLPTYRIYQPMQFNNPGTTLSGYGLTQIGFTQVNSNLYEADATTIPNFGRVEVSLNPSGFTKVREYTLNSDILPADPRFFNPLEFAAQPVVQQALTHISTQPHYEINNDHLSTTSTLSANFLYYRYQNYAYNGGLQLAYGGDAWIQGGVNDAHPIEPLPDTTMVYWIALYNGEVAGKRVRLSDGTVVAAPVNGKKRIRCAFTLPANVVPVPDDGVLLRRCNPTWGYQKGLA